MGQNMNKSILGLMATTVVLSATVSANAYSLTGQRALVGQSKQQIAQCAGGKLISKQKVSGGSAWTYRSRGRDNFLHIWRHIKPNDPTVDDNNGSFVPRAPASILYKINCDVRFIFKGGRVRRVDYSTNGGNWQRKLICGVVTDYCLPY